MTLATNSTHSQCWGILGSHSGYLEFRPGQLGLPWSHPLSSPPVASSLSLERLLLLTGKVYIQMEVDVHLALLCQRGWLRCVYVCVTDQHQAGFCGKDLGSHCCHADHSRQVPTGSHEESVPY